MANPKGQLRDKPFREALNIEPTKRVTSHSSSTAASKSGAINPTRMI